MDRVRHLIISGLPASGKSTLARRLAPALGLPVLDKDDLLEALFAERGVGDEEWRAALSREADERLRRAARRGGAACLVSWWRHPRGPADTGTPTEWLGSLAAPPLEVHCVCPAAVAAVRFLARRRHPGHLDGAKTAADVAERFAAFAGLGPLGYGPALPVATDGAVDLAPIVAWLRAQLGAETPGPRYTFER